MKILTKIKVWIKAYISKINQDIDDIRNNDDHWGI